MSSASMNSVSAIAPGAGGLPKLTLVAPDGATAEIYLYGGHVVSWVPAGGRERLFLSRAAVFRAGTPIRGGVPIAFPQFGTTGPLPIHGLARLMPWEFVSAEAVGQGARALLRLSDTKESRNAWDHQFVAEMAVEIVGSKLSMTLAVTNPGAAQFTFTAALHTYIAVSDIDETAVEGLDGRWYSDSTRSGARSQQDSPQIGFSGEVSRVYLEAPDESRVVESDRTTVVQKSGFADVVVWNPGADRCATVPDFEPDDYRRFVCVEAVALGTPIQLPPGERWQGNQTLLA